MSDACATASDIAPTNESLGCSPSDAKFTKASCKMGTGIPV